MDHVPIGGGYNGHLADGEVLVQLVESSCRTAATGGYDGSRRLMGQISTGGIEQSVHKPNQSTVGRGVIHRASEYKAIGFCAFGCDLVETILVAEGAFACLVTSAAGHAAVERLAADLQKLCFDAVGMERFGSFTKRGVGAAVLVGAAVKQ